MPPKRRCSGLVAQLREFGPRFNVVVLDAEDDRFERQVKELTRTRPGLAEAIRTAPADSIFFYADEKVRRLPRAEERERFLKVVRAKPDDPEAQRQAYANIFWALLNSPEFVLCP